jgi:hypothetical protein
MSIFDKNWIDMIQVSIDWKKYNLNNLSLNLNYFLDSNESIIINVKWKVDSDFEWKLQIWLSTISFKDLEDNKIYKKTTNVNGYVYDIK